jgi:hypothetical protein
VIVVAMTLGGYPGLERFYLPAAGVACVLAGVAVARLAVMAAGVLSGRGGPPIAVAGAGAVVVALVAIVVALGTTRIDTARAQRAIAARAVTRLDGLSAAVRAVGGHRGVYPCLSSFAAVNHSVQTALAWKLHVTLGRVGTAMTHPGLMFVGPWDTIDGGPPAVSRRLRVGAMIASVGVWRVYRVTAPGRSARCVGT